MMMVTVMVMIMMISGDDDDDDCGDGDDGDGGGDVDGDDDVMIIEENLPTLQLPFVLVSSVVTGTGCSQCLTCQRPSLTHLRILDTLL